MASANRIRPRGVDHHGYVETVRATLLSCNLNVGTAAFKPGHGHMCSAAMTLLPPDEDFDEPWHPTFVSAQFVELRWNEEDGWSLLALHPAGATLLPTAWHHGFPASAPEAVRAWLAALLTKPTIPAAGTAATSCAARSAAIPTMRLR